MGSQEGPWRGFGTYFSWIGEHFRCILYLILVLFLYGWACCKIVVRVLQECLIQGLLQDCPPARPRPRFKIIVARLLHGCCKACCKIVARVLQECLIQGLLQACCKIARPPARGIASRWLLQDCCKVAARMLQCLLQGLLWECCKACHKIAARVLQGCCKTCWAASGIFLSLLGACFTLNSIALCFPFCSCSGLGPILGGVGKSCCVYLTTTSLIILGELLHCFLYWLCMECVWSRYGICINFAWTIPGQFGGNHRNT